MGEDGHIEAVKTTNRVITALVELDGAGVSAVAEEADLPVTTAFNHLDTLRAVGFVCRKGQEYYASSRFLDIGTRVRRQNELYRLSKPHIDELAVEYDEAVGLLVEEEGYSIMYYAEEREGLDLDINMGTRVPMNLTAAGKAMLACMDDDRVEAVLDERGMPKLTEQTIATREAMFDELEAIREQGYAVAHEENVDGMRGVAVGLDGPGTDVGAILLYGPASRLAEDELHARIARDMRQVKEIIEVNLQAAELN